MNQALQAKARLAGHVRPRRSAAALGALLALACLVAPPAANAAPFIWDQDQDKLDDRAESVHLSGYSFSFENQDTTGLQRIEVLHDGLGLLYGVYVVFDHAPTPLDLITLNVLGMPVHFVYEGATAVRSLASFEQLQSAAALPGVERIEAVPVFYPQVREGAAGIALRDPTEQVFPTWAGTGGADGSGVVLAILDTGINDAPDGFYPGHESLIGRCLGGAEFTHGDSLFDTPRGGSINPVDRGGVLTNAHGTHVAGIAVGSGGPSGYAEGMAPGARFADVKVLSDAGSGTGVAEGLDWCIHNRTRVWGAVGYQGIQVVNLSLSSSDESDGTDVVSRLADRAVELGIVVVASMGNGGHDHFTPSPAGAGRVLAVGAMDDQHSAIHGDDLWCSFGNYGPRASDGDGDAFDEEKPDLLAPGVSVLSADGSLSSDGAQYQRLSGTSMSSAFVAGAVAALRSAYPSLGPDPIAAVLRATARRELGGVPAGEGGADPRWSSPRGFGVLDLYAAALEIGQPERSQVAHLDLSASATAVQAVLLTQRERGAAVFRFERAPDEGGTPGTFAAVDSVTAAGDSSLASAVNRTAYARSWTVPEEERGVAFWYRVSFDEGGAHDQSHARRFTSPSGPPVATIELVVVHNACDHDLVGNVTAGGASGNLSGTTASGGPSFTMPGTSAAVSSDWVTGTSTTGNVAWTFHIDVPPGSAEAFLPPSTSTPWVLRVSEGGYLNRSGRITGFRIVWHAPGGDVTYEGGPMPLVTVEGSSEMASVPQTTLGVGPGPGASAVRYGPNPVAAGGTVTFAVPGAPQKGLEVYDLAGRRVAGLDFAPSSGGAVATWQTRGPSGHPLPAGLYVARVGDGAAVRVVVLGR